MIAIRCSTGYGLRMGKLIELSGNLFDSTARAIGHGINVKGAMNAGIAAEFARIYPDMKKEYKALCAENKITPGTTWLWEDSKSDDIVLNIASQDKPGKFARLNWLKSGVEDSIDQLQAIHPETRAIALPRIGCGIGGLDWLDVRGVLSDVASRGNVDIELWTQ